MLAIFITNQSGSFDVTQLVDTVTLSGEYRSCARSLDFGLLSTPADNSLPQVDCAVGSAVTLEHKGQTLFSGFVMDRTKSTNGNTINLACMDRGIYLNRNYLSASYTATPEAATALLCKDFGIATGLLATTGVTVKRKFFAASLYDIIATLYTEAAKATGKAYAIIFNGDKLTVREKGSGPKLLLVPGSNLMVATVSESSKSIVNRVLVQNESGTTVQDLQDKASIQLYGQMQQILRQSQGKDVLGDAKKLLENSAPTQKITVENLGDAHCITGGAVLMEEPYTGLYGLFFIDGDTHAWKNNLYFNKLTLNLKAVMDEKAAGELLGGA